MPAVNPTLYFDVQFLSHIPAVSAALFGSSYFLDFLPEYLHLLFQIPEYQHQDSLSESHSLPEQGQQYPLTES